MFTLLSNCVQSVAYPGDSAKDQGTEVCSCAVQPYQPSLSAAWLFQRSMALKVGQLCAPRGRRAELSGFLPPSHINRLLQANFRVMQARATRTACRPE